MFAERQNSTPCPRTTIWHEELSIRIHQHFHLHTKVQSFRLEDLSSTTLHLHTKVQSFRLEDLSSTTLHLHSKVQSFRLGDFSLTLHLYTKWIAMVMTGITVHRAYSLFQQPWLPSARLIHSVRSHDYKANTSPPSFPSSFNHRLSRTCKSLLVLEVVHANST